MHSSETAFGRQSASVFRRYLRERCHVSRGARGWGPSLSGPNAGCSSALAVKRPSNSDDPTQTITPNVGPPHVTVAGDLLFRLSSQPEQAAFSFVRSVTRPAERRDPKLWPSARSCLRRATSTRTRRRPSGMSLRRAFSNPAFVRSEILILSCRATVAIIAITASSLFFSQRDHRIHSSCPPRRNGGRGKRYRRQQQRHCPEGEHFSRTHPK